MSEKPPEVFKDPEESNIESLMSEEEIAEFRMITLSYINLELHKQLMNNYRLMLVLAVYTLFGSSIFDVVDYKWFIYFNAVVVLLFCLNLMYQIVKTELFVRKFRTHIEEYNLYNYERQTNHLGAEPKTSLKSLRQALLTCKFTYAVTLINFAQIYKMISEQGLFNL